MHAKRFDRTVKPVVFGLWIKPQTNDFHEFVFIVLCFVAIGSFTADGGLLQQAGGVKTTPQKTRFRSVNNYKELQGIHIQVKSEHVGTLTMTELMTQSRTTSTTTCLTWTQT